ncbi:Scaffold-type E3 ligase [Parahypoxylon ruwenzoriense]
MPPASSLQKAALASFTSITGASEKIAQRYLKNTNYRLNEAIDAYFQTNAGASAQSVEPRLAKMFDSLRNEAEDGKDSLGVSSSMSYIELLDVDMEGPSLWVALELLQVPSIGETTREGFVNGWKLTGAEPKIESQKQHIARLTESLTRDRDLLRRVYRYAFVAGKEGDQRSLTLDTAIVYWDGLFKKPGQVWVGRVAGIDWLNEWKTFLREKWTRSVSRDMWNQTLEFALKSIEDESLGFWSEDGAWPGVIDDFVAWYRHKSEMDVDA